MANRFFHALALFIVPTIGCMCRYNHSFVTENRGASAQPSLRYQIHVVNISDGVSRLGLGLETCLETRFLAPRS